jgi:hypothetical protein
MGSQIRTAGTRRSQSLIKRNSSITIRETEVLEEGRGLIEAEMAEVLR